MTAPYPTDHSRDQSEQVAETSVGELIGNISNDLSTLFRQEVELAKVELKQEASKAGKVRRIPLPPELVAEVALRDRGPGVEDVRCEGRHHPGEVHGALARVR